MPSPKSGKLPWNYCETATSSAQNLFDVMRHILFETDNTSFFKLGKPKYLFAEYGADIAAPVVVESLRQFAEQTAISDAISFERSKFLQQL